MIHSVDAFSFERTEAMGMITAVRHLVADIYNLGQLLAKFGALNLKNWYPIYVSSSFVKFTYHGVAYLI